ncbi:hypothetical protein ACLKMY_37285 [Paraburkholderia mimosarum]|uniref:hypothetical protein n=1 Tax=Paraburkholderia mimosarum TaxID=312026 RepID=UPI0039C4D476
MQSTELLAQPDQFVLVTFVLLAQHLAQQGRRTRWRLIALHASLAKPGREGWLDHQQPRGEPRLFVDLPGTQKIGIEAPPLPNRDHFASE